MPLSQTFVYVHRLRLSMIEPGPVHTEFETKMMEDVAKMEYPGADADTVRYFKDVYLPSSIDIFEAMGQSPEDIAKVSEYVSNSYLSELLTDCFKVFKSVCKSPTAAVFFFVFCFSSALRRLLSQITLALGI